MRKGIEAKGINDYNAEVAKGLSDGILKLRGIEATRELAKSENSKIVIVGGKDGMPIILGNRNYSGTFFILSPNGVRHDT